MPKDIYTTFLMHQHGLIAVLFSSLFLFCSLKMKNDPRTKFCNKFEKFHLIVMIDLKAQIDTACSAPDQSFQQRNRRFEDQILLKNKIRISLETKTIIDSECSYFNH